MLDGSDAIADWPLLNALVNTASGASWVSIHDGGGVGIGRSIHAGQVSVADGPPWRREKLHRVLTNDPGMGMLRHVDAGYEQAAPGGRPSGGRPLSPMRSRPEPGRANRAAAGPRGAREPPCRPPSCIYPHGIDAAQVVAVARRGARVELSPDGDRGHGRLSPRGREAWPRAHRRPTACRPGFGALATRHIRRRCARRLQASLIRSHCGRHRRAGRDRGRPGAHAPPAENAGHRLYRGAARLGRATWPRC